VEDVIDQPPSLGVRAQGGIAYYTSSADKIPQTTFTASDLVAGKVSDSRYELDLGLFFGSRANLLLDYYTRRYEVDKYQDLPDSCYGARFQQRFSCDQTGYTIQTGVLLDRKASHELSMRYSHIDNDTKLNKDGRREATINYTYYFLKHTMQLSASFSSYLIGVNAQGSSGFALKTLKDGTGVQVNNGDFLNPADYPGMTGDKNWLGTIQFQWTF
jgi:hypothetical protein